MHKNANNPRRDPPSDCEGYFVETACRSLVFWRFDLSAPPHQVFIRVQDSNDNPPVFSQPAYDVSVSEDVPVDVELVRVRASDLDERARLSYSIYGSVDPASMRLFRVNPGTGIVYTTDRLDYEARTQHILTIMVRRDAKDAVCVRARVPLGARPPSQVILPPHSIPPPLLWLPHLISADFFHSSLPTV